MKTLSRFAAVLLPSLLAAAEPVLSETERLRADNRELRTRLVAQEKELQQLRLWLANVVSDKGYKDAGEREALLLARLNEVCRRGRELSLKAISVSEEMRKTVASLPLGPARKAQLDLRLDELDAKVRSFSAVTEDKAPHSPQECLILAIDRELGVGVLSAGSGDGVFDGMVFSPRDGSGNCSLRVIGTRPRVALVELPPQSENLRVGMTVTALRGTRK